MKLSFAGLKLFLKEAFLDNIGLKALSLAFAVGLFVYLQGQEDEQQRTVAAAVVLRLPPESARRELMTPIPANVHVTLRGSARALDNLIQVGIPPVEIDLREAQLDTLVFEPSMFNVPRGIDIVIIDPPSIPLEWQEVVTRKIPVQASITGTPAEGFVVKGEPQVEPEAITADGPENLVEVMQFARLAPFDVSGLSEGSYRRRLAIDAPPARVSYLGPQSAAVTVVIARRVIEVRFTRRRVEAVGVTQAVLSPRDVDVTITGPPEVVRALRAEQIVPRADLREVPGLNLEAMRHGSVNVKVQVDLANAEAEIQPPSVTVKW
jgi:YbbR domain-containing protein